MTVADLIIELQKMPQDKTVTVLDTERYVSWEPVIKVQDQTSQEEVRLLV